MSLQMSINDPDGTTHGVSYIVTQSVLINYLTDTATVELVTYANKGAHVSGKEPTRHTRIDVDISELLKGDVDAAVTAALLLMPEFEGAIEVP